MDRYIFVDMGRMTLRLASEKVIAGVKFKDGVADPMTPDNRAA
ncbi:MULTISPECIES: hypothetical protein [Rhizobium]|uniref:Uncharacterized protein n=1 Tax=Rhizobium aouanii TaxID=3118145 RepID=A0ABU8CIS0_9HYPH|nr:hypothetical protein [Rhizobium acaciae]MCW1750241.1 hypothetical protein [Rhizobium acaciae]